MYYYFEKQKITILNNKKKKKKKEKIQTNKYFVVMAILKFSRIFETIEAEKLKRYKMTDKRNATDFLCQLF